MNCSTLDEWPTWWSWRKKRNRISPPPPSGTHNLQVHWSKGTVQEISNDSSFNGTELVILYDIQKGRNLIKNIINSWLIVSLPPPLFKIQDSQRCSWNFHLINNVKGIEVFLGRKGFHHDNSFMLTCSRNAQVTFAENSKILKL